VSGSCCGWSWDTACRIPRGSTGVVREGEKPMEG